jgi:hypothetical protein
MNKYVKAAIAATSIGLYGLIIGYVAPSNDPYFLLGLALVGWFSWLFGTSAGLVVGLLLFPSTKYIYDQFEVSTSYTAIATSPAFIAIEVLAAVAFGYLRQTSMNHTRKAHDLEQANTLLQEKLSQVQELGGIHSFCTSCKKIKADDGEWMRVDTYLKEKTKAEFSHGICPSCAQDYHKTTTPHT